MDRESDRGPGSAESVAALVAAAAAAEARLAAKAASDTQAAVRAAAVVVAAAAAADARTTAAAVDAKAAVVAQAAEAAAEARRTEARLTHNLLHDELTGLPSRRLLLDRLTRALVRSKRTRTMVAVVYVDLDCFKAVNDTLGHAAGDQLLVSVAARLLECVRDTDTCARIGGDEFVLVCEDLDGPQDAAPMVRRVSAAFAEGVPLGDRSVNVRASFGVAFSTPGSLPGDLLEEADAAMYRSKRVGKSWALQHVHGNQWAIVNLTGQDAVKVRLSARGSLLVFGVREWINTVERWPTGVSVEVVAQTAWRRSDPPQLRIAWSMEDEPEQRELILPWPRSA